MKVGMLLAGRTIYKPAQECHDIGELGLDTVWLPDLATNRTTRGGVSGNGWDPFVLGARLMAMHEGPRRVGIAVVRLDRRSPECTARCVESILLDSQASRELIVGCGWSSLKNEVDRAAFTRRASEVWALLDGSVDDYKVLADLRSRVSWGLACQSRTVWKLLGSTGERLRFTSTLNPGALERESIACMPSPIALQARLKLDLQSVEALRLEHGVLVLGRLRLQQLALAWRSAGVQELILQTPEDEPSENCHELVNTLKEVLQW